MHSSIAEEYIAALTEKARHIPVGDPTDPRHVLGPIIDARQRSPVRNEEIVGPVAPVMTYETLDQAVQIINASEYGLSVGILAGEAYRAFELAGRIESGAVHVNDQTVDDEASIPFGGTKASGVGGRFGGPSANLDTFTETQWVTMQADIESYPF